MRKLMLFSAIIFFLLVSIVSAIEGLEISDISVKYNSDTQVITKNNGFYDDNVDAGTDFRIEVEVENTFKSSTDINNIQITANISDIKRGKNISDASDKFDLVYGKKKIKTLSLDIPDDADELMHKVDINVVGTDEKRNKYNLNFSFYFNVEDEDHNIILYNTKLNKSEILCNEYANLFVWLENNGKYDESRVSLEAENKALGFYEKYNDISIDEGEKYSKLFKIDANKINISKKTIFPIELRAYYKGNILDDIETLNLTIDPCGAIIKPVNEVSDTEQNNQNKEEISNDHEIYVKDQEEQPVSSSGDTNTPKQKDTKQILAVFLAVLFLLLLILIILFFVIRRNNKPKVIVY